MQDSPSNQQGTHTSSTEATHQRQFRHPWMMLAIGFVLVGMISSLVTEAEQSKEDKAATIQRIQKEQEDKLNYNIEHCIKNNLAYSALQEKCISQREFLQELQESRLKSVNNGLK